MTIDSPVALWGIALSVAAAVAWAGQYVFVRVGTHDGSVSDAVLVALLCNVLLVVPAAAAFHYPDYGLTWRAVVVFAGAGVVGMLLGRVYQFRSVQTIGASRTAPIVAATALVSALLAVVFLGETLTVPHLIGIVLVVGGVAVISREMAGDAPATGEAGGAPTAPGEAGTVLLWPLLAALLYGIEPILVKIGLAEGTPTMVGLAIMSTTGTIGFLAHRQRANRPPTRATFAGAQARWYVAAGVASTVALVTYFAALAVAPVVVVIPIIQVSPLVVAGLSYAVLPRRLERVTWPLVAGATVVVLGATLVSLSG